MRIFVFVGLIGLMLSALYWTFLNVSQRMLKFGLEPSNLVFRIEKYEPLHQIATRLKRKNMIFSIRIFLSAAQLQGLDKVIKHGEFALNRSMSINEILSKISSNDYFEHDIYIKECITSWELMKVLRKKELFIDDLSSKKIGEGVFAPDTYKATYGTNLSDFLNLMRRRQSIIITRAWENMDRPSPVKNKFELLILASMIEKEAASVSEMPKVASVFVNRLNKGMRLQSDPTVTYGVDLGNIENRQILKKSDLKIFSEYNTYTISGLPKSPICNPSEIAINAAARPEKTNYLYFVMSNSGKHMFSKTFNEHKKNVSKWHNFKIKSK